MTPPAVHITGNARIDGAALFAPIDLCAKAGRWTCILGPSGVGKSSLLHLVAGCAEGVDWDGSIRAGDGVPLPLRVSLMAQSDLLLPWLTVRQNAMLGARLRGERGDDARCDTVLDELGLGDMGARKPGALSGGQRQRVALARTLMEDRPVVLLDEPFSALDVATRARMQALAAARLAGRTVLHVTHDPAEAARLGESIQLLTPARLISVAPPAMPIPRAPDAPETLDTTGRLTRLLLEADPS